MIWATFLTLVLILKHFFWDKVQDFMQNRESQVRETFENADRVNKLADDKLSEYERRIANIESEGRDIIKNAKAKADAQAKDILDAANQKAIFMIQQAEEEIQRQQNRAIGEMKQQIVSLAVLAAEKVLEKKLDTTGQEDLITGILEQAGTTEWQM
jgi:F-type H+-transporting ATPase subunit b